MKKYLGNMKKYRENVQEFRHHLDLPSASFHLPWFSHFPAPQNFPSPKTSFFLQFFFLRQSTLIPICSKISNSNPLSLFQASPPCLPVPQSFQVQTPISLSHSHSFAPCSSPFPAISLKFSKLCLPPSPPPNFSLSLSLSLSHSLSLSPSPNTFHFPPSNCSISSFLDPLYHSASSSHHKF